MRALLILSLLPVCWAQEASSGFELNTTLSGEGFYSTELTDAPRLGAPESAGFRAMLYPLIKLNQHWTFEGSYELHSRPYFAEEFSTQGYGVKGDLLQAHLNYSQVWNHGSIVVRAGILSSTFGSFLLRYDDSVNPLVDMPLTYGYYSGITPLGLAGVSVDATEGNFDFRAQLTNSSPLNRRSIFDHDQYGNWAGGVGYTILQGLRIGASAFHGPYLDRESPYYWPGELPPRDLPGSGIGIDGSWGRGPWNLYGEMQWFQMDYTVIPTFRERGGYLEARRILSPRWYAAARFGALRASAGPGDQVYEAALGFRPGPREIVKFDYMLEQYPGSTAGLDHTVAIQFVTAFRAISGAWN